MRGDSSFAALLEQALPHLSDETKGRLSIYYDLVLKWNQRISLTTLTSPREFVERHVEESYLASSLITDGIRRVWDIGSGLGVPGIPIAVMRPELEVKLVESNRKKAIFLEEACDVLQLGTAEVMNVRFESLAKFGSTDCVTLRAVERMERLVSKLVDQARDAGQLLVFGGPDLKVPKHGERQVKSHLIAGSHERFLYEVG